MLDVDNIVIVKTAQIITYVQKKIKKGEDGRELRTIAHRVFYIQRYTYILYRHAIT